MNTDNEIKDSFWKSVTTDNCSQAAILLSSGTDVNAPVGDGKTALAVAVERENFKMVELLLLYGADINVSFYSNLYCTFETPVITAARLQNNRILELLLQHGELKDETESRVGKTALQWAATYGDTYMAAMLLAHGSDVNWIGPYFHSALHYAATTDKTDMVKFLLDHGSEVNINNDGRTAVHTAAVRGNLPMIQHFIHKHFDVNQKDNFDYSPFTLACLRGHLPVIRYLMDIAGSRPDVNDGLLKASESGHVDIMDFLIQNGADVNHKQGAAILTAAARGHCKAVELLLENGVNFRAVNDHGSNALQCALVQEEYDIIRLLIVHGLDCSRTLGVAEDEDLSPLKMAFMCNDLCAAKWMVEAGCCLTLEPWMTLETIHDKLDSLDENHSIRPTPGRRKLNVEKQRDICVWLKHQLQQPPRLTKSCRTSLRCHLSDVTGGTSILPLISKLPLPQSLLNFLALNDLYVT